VLRAIAIALAALVAVCPRHIELPRPAIKRADGFLWFWIGDHKACEALIS
jgi:hypothetical protein